MSYRVRFEGAALVQLNGLPAAAFDALVERLVDLIDEPWDASVMPPGDDPAFRMTVFDASRSNPVPSCRAVSAGTGAVKNTQA